MTGQSSIEPYPWDSLESMSRKSARSIAALARAAPERPTLGELGQRLGELCECEVSLVAKRVSSTSHLHQTPDALYFVLSDGTLELSLLVEPQLADVLLGKLLKQAPATIAGPALLRDPGVRGMLSRLAVEVARGSTSPLVLCPLVEPPPETPLTALALSATLLVAGNPYQVTAHVGWRGAPRAASERPRLASLGRLPISVPLVAAFCSIDRKSLSELAEGDALLPGAAAGMTADLRGSLCMAPSAGNRGVFFEIVGPRSVKLRGVSEVENLEDRPMAEPSDHELTESIAETVLEAPVVVRVEVASITLPALELANLRPGDVISTDQPIGKLSTLRVAGREIAQGELVNIDGELGVRIRKLARKE